MKLTIFFLVTFICVNGFSSDHKMNHHGMKVEKDNKSRQFLESGAKEQFLNVLKINESLHGSFFKYDAKGVEKNAKAMRKALGEIKDSALLKLLNGTSEYLGKLTSKETQKSNYHHYNLVSKKLLSVLNSFDLGPIYNAYSCPMVQKVWIQNSKKMEKVHNPYASYMPYCGSKDSNY